MKELVKNNNTGKLSIEDVAPPQLKKGHVLVQNECSAVSVGTELSSIEIARKNIFQKAKSRPDDLKKVVNLAKKEGWYNSYKIAMERLENPSIMGYSTVGIVIGVSDTVEKFKVGDRVACGGNKYAGHSEIISVPINLCVKVPKDVDIGSAAFTTIGSIAIQAVRQLEANLGEKVLVIGLGLIGQITVQLLKASGCIPIGVDLDSTKVNFSRENYDIEAFTNTDSNLNSKIRNITEEYGVDSAIITAATSSNEPIELAINLLRDRGKITVVGNVSMNIDWKKAYEKEITVNLSRSYGPGRYDKKYEEKGIDYPIAYVRWSENRNMQVFLELISAGKLDIASLITKTYDFSDAIKAFDEISNKNSFLLGVLFKYPKYDGNIENTIYYKNKKVKNLGEINLGIIGAGNYARAHLIPNFISSNRVNLVGVCSNNGRNSGFIAKKYGFNYATSDPNKIIKDAEINCVVIATRHNTHSDLVVKSLRENKHVFVEKPLAITKEQLEDIKKAYKGSKGTIMVGFNRRYSPFIIKAFDFFKEVDSPIMINYRINSGKLPHDHWFYDREIGGGRISSEPCHFLDICHHLIGHAPVKLIAETSININKEKPDEDSVSIIVRYSNGSIANIFYSSDGAESLSKERIEVHGGGKTTIIEDFRYAEFYNRNKSQKKSIRKIDKGQRNQIIFYLENLISTGKSLIDFNSIIQTTELSLDATESARTGQSKTYTFD